jgi:cytochrome c-type biogenesis protein CcmH/NrfG
MEKDSFGRTGTVTKKFDFEQALEALKAGKPDVAETLCQEHLKLHPESVEHLRLLGHAMMEQRRFGEAETQLKRHN